MICDDSLVIRSAIARILEADPAIRVVARTGNGQAALDALKLHDIDVVVLDIEMPVMDGLTALPLLLAADPGLRIIMASTLTTRGADIAMRALRLGAADYMPKPSAAGFAAESSFGPELIAKVKGLARLRLRQRPATAAPFQVPPVQAAPLPLRSPPRHTPQLLAIGSSTGGPNALFALVQGLSPRLPVPVVITQHMPATFTPILADHIAKLGVLPCAEAHEGARLQPGRILLAPGDHHLLVRRDAAGMFASLSDAPAENYCRPSVDPMLRSASEATDGRVLVVMLTGMGHDGMAGTRAVIDRGGAAIAQDEATSVVWGMPGAVARAGLAYAVLPLPQIGPKVLAVFGVRA
ncbi:MAG: chemotaxis response regulator protein-glutamate methylesterase [Rhodospirillales bacterium]